MSKSIFISCVHEDNNKIHTIQKCVSEKKLGDVIITHETEDKRQQGKELIRQHIKSKIEGAAIILVLIGNDTHNHEWIEARFAQSNPMTLLTFYREDEDTDGKGRLPSLDLWNGIKRKQYL
ncbi:MAG: TIR domain-containing protein [Ignavibacteriae bacterium]|nr:TIR domain-containing protein [Ignavibacteriota bacterium]